MRALARVAVETGMPLVLTSSMETEFQGPTLDDLKKIAPEAWLAFLWSGQGCELLRRVALNDTESGVRLSALWAYGFAGGEGAEELLLRQAEYDSDATSRASFREMIECLAANRGLWWKI